MASSFGQAALDAVNKLDLEYTYAVEKVTDLETQLWLRGDELIGARQEIEALKKQIAELIQGAAEPDWKMVRDFKFPNGLPPYYIDGTKEAFSITGAGYGKFQVRPGIKRCEMGGKHETLAMIVREPLLRRRRYKMAFMVSKDTSATLSMVNLWQFWAKSSEPPVLCAEARGNSINIVRNIKESPLVGREVLAALPLVFDRWYALGVEAVWDGQAGHVKVVDGLSGAMITEYSGKTTYEGLNPVHKFGAYAPGYANEVDGPTISVTYDRTIVEEAL